MSIWKIPKTKKETKKPKNNDECQIWDLGVALGFFGIATPPPKI
jgi:hypothetical protein